jgi:hypothetical protein
MVTLNAACVGHRQKQNALDALSSAIQRARRQPLPWWRSVSRAERLKAFGLQVSCWSGGRTTYNRTNQSYGKSHWLDAVCVGATGGRVHIPPGLQPLHVSATGRGSRQMCRVDTYGFPRTSAKSRRVVNGFKTGDLVKALVNKGKKPGTYVGRVSVRKSGSFNIKTEAGTIQGIAWKHCSLLQRADGYNYYRGDSVSSST